MWKENTLNNSLDQFLTRRREKLTKWKLIVQRHRQFIIFRYSKKAVDDIIAKSVNTNKDKGIVFTIKFGTRIIHLDFINKYNLGTNSHTPNFRPGHGQRYVNYNSNQQFNSIMNG